MIAEVLAAYGNEVAPIKKTARNMGYNISNLLKWWGDKHVSDITKKSCREYVKTKTPQAAGQDLKILRIAVKYWLDASERPAWLTALAGKLGLIDALAGGGQLGVGGIEVGQISLFDR